MLLHFFILTRDTIMQDIRSKRFLSFLGMYLAVFGLLMYGVLHIQASINEQVAMQGFSNTQQNLLYALFEGVLVAQTGQREVIEFLTTVPFLNIALFLIGLFGTPILLGIMNYDKISQEIFDGSLRFKVFRTSRLTIYLAKFAGSMGVSLIATLLALFGSLVWAVVVLPGFSPLPSLWIGLQLWLVAQVFLSVFVALFVGISSWVTRPFVGLMTSIASYIFLLILPVWVSFISPFDGNYLQGLFYRNWSALLPALIPYVIMTTVVVTVGYLRFAKRDLT